jgi:SAM-dependent methyltransferase
MTDVRDHYDSHLGPVYAWMAGPFEEATRPGRDLFERLGLAPGPTGVAVDFGCGHGLQAVPLAERGFEVVAVDTCAELLGDLERRRGDLPIRTLARDMTDCRDALPARIDVAVCMGDTLTHLPDRDAVERWIRLAADVLVGGGVLVASFRDYVSAPLEGDARFIPVRSDADRILTCFLESEGDRIRVHDLLHERDDDGWRLRVSSYAKLRLAPEWVVDVLGRSGLDARIEGVERGMVTIRAVRASRSDE